MVEKVIAVVGARLNSSRLPRKQLLPLAGTPLIEHLFRRLEATEGIDHIVLATTADTYNKDLVEWAKAAGKACMAYTGDVNDLMGRVDAVVRQEDAGIIVYVCGDSPLVEPVTLGRLITAIKADPQADWARLSTLPDGKTYIHEGFMVYRRTFWQRLEASSIEPFEREHVGSVFHYMNKTLPQRQAVVEDEPIFHALNHRISVDTPSDYAFMCHIYERWYRDHDPRTLVDLRWVIALLENEPEVARINAKVYQRAVRDRTLKAQIITTAGSTAGLGHARRMVVAAHHLQDDLGAGIEVLVVGEPLEEPWFTVLRHRSLADFPAAFAALDPDADLVLLDVPELSDEILALIAGFHSSAKLVCVGKLPTAEEGGELFDAFYLPSHQQLGQSGRWLDRPAVSGWDCYLLPPPALAVMREPNRALVLTGGSDRFGLGTLWPALLDRALPHEVAITWVKGPFAKEPYFRDLSPRRGLDYIHAPASVADLMASHSAALTVYGVSYYECLHQRIPTVGYAPEPAACSGEIAAVQAQGGHVVTSDPEAAVYAFAALWRDHDERARLAGTDWGLERRTDDDKHPLSALALRLTTHNGMQHV